MSVPVALPPAIPPPVTPMPVPVAPVAASPVPSPAATSTAVTPSSPVATLGGTPQALAALAAPANSASFAGTVAPGDSAGSLVLVTSFGTFALSSTMPLTIGSQLTLQTIASTPGGVAILTIDNAPTVSSTPVQPATGVPLPAVPEEAPPTIVDLGTLISATVIATASQAIAGSGSAPQAATSPLPPGADPITTAAPIASPSAVAQPSGRPVSPAPLDAHLLAEMGTVISTSPPDAETPIALTAAEQEKLQAALSEGAGTATRSDTSIPADGPRAATSETLPTGTIPGPQPAPGPGSLPVGTSLLLRVIAVQAVAAPAGSALLASVEPSATAPAAPSPAAMTAPALVGTIHSASPTGAIVETAMGALRLAPLPSLSSGTPVALHLLPGDPATVAVTIAAGVSPDGNGRAMSPLPATSPAPLRAPAQASDSDPSDAPSEPPAASPPIAVAPNPITLSAPAPRPGGGDAFIARVFIAPSATRADARPQAVIGEILAETDPSPSAPSLVETPLGVLAVSPRLAVSTGSLLLLALQDAPLAPDALVVGRAGGLERGWPALEATVAAISQTGPTLATRLISDLSVHGGETLAATLLFLVATLRGSGPPTWPGTAIERALALAGRNDVKQQLGEDIGVLRQIAADPATGHWQVFLLPVHDGTAFRPVRLYLARRDKRASRGRGDEEKSRFVLEFEMSRIGALQLDGFIRRRRFDLALRSRTPLAPALRADVTRIFHARIAAAGLAGEIEFATVAQFDIAPLDGLRAPVGLAV